MHVLNCLAYSHNSKGKENSQQSPDKGTYLAQTLAFHTVPLALSIQHSGPPYLTDPSIEAFLKV